MNDDLDSIQRGAPRAWLDGANALDEQLNGVVPIGLQTICVHTGEADFVVALYSPNTDFLTNAQSNIADI